MEEFSVPVVSNLQIYALIVSKNVFVKEPYELVFMQVEQVHKAWRNIVDFIVVFRNKSVPVHKPVSPLGFKNLLFQRKN